MLAALPIRDRGTELRRIAAQPRKLQRAAAKLLAGRGVPEAARTAAEAIVLAADTASLASYRSDPAAWRALRRQTQSRTPEAAAARHEARQQMSDLSAALSDGVIDPVGRVVAAACALDPSQRDVLVLALLATSECGGAVRLAGSDPEVPADLSRAANVARKQAKAKRYTQSCRRRAWTPWPMRLSDDQVLLITRWRESGLPVAEFCAGADVSPSTFRRWCDRLAAAPAAAPDARGRQSALDTDPELADHALGVIAQRAHVSSATLHRELVLLFGIDRVPSERSVRRWRSRTESEHGMVMSYHRDPDRARRRYQAAVGSRSEGIVRPHQR